MCKDDIRQNWSYDEVEVLLNKGLLELIHLAGSLHQKYQNSQNIYVNTLVSVKTGKCSQDCAYCAQSSIHNTTIEVCELSVEEVILAAKNVKNSGVPRVCLSISGKSPSDILFNRLLQMIAEIRKLNLQVCCTLGTLSVEQILALKNAGISAYNHNIDTSAEYYPKIISTRTYAERIKMLNKLIDADVPYCSGGIVGLGETIQDRAKMLITLANMKKHPYTVPINNLVPIKGTPLENNRPVSTFDLVRIIAITRIMMPKTIVGLAAGRVQLNKYEQTLCFAAGANSVFAGAKLLTTDNNTFEKDKNLFEELGLNIVDLNN